MTSPTRRTRTLSGRPIDLPSPAPSQPSSQPSSLAAVDYAELERRILAQQHETLQGPPDRFAVYCEKGLNQCRDTFCGCINSREYRRRAALARAARGAEVLPEHRKLNLLPDHHDLGQWTSDRFSWYLACIAALAGLLVWVLAFTHRPADMPGLIPVEQTETQEVDQ